MSNDRDRELMWNVVKGIGIQGEHSAGRQEPRGAAGILGSRTGKLVEEKSDDGEHEPWTGWAVGTVVPDDATPLPHDATSEPSIGHDEDLLRIVFDPRMSARGDETEVEVDIDPTVETYVDEGGDTQVDIERAPDDHTELDELVAKGAAKVRVARGTERIAPLRADFEEDDDLDEEDDELELDDEAIDLAQVSRKFRPRHRRRDRPRSKTIALKRLTREELRRGALENPPVEGVERPHTRAECSDAPRPCPWVACKHHLYLDINPNTGSIKINFPDLEPWELEHTCALDVADAGGKTLEEIGVITNLTRERVRQVEVRGLLTLKTRSRSLR